MNVSSVVLLSESFVTVIVPVTVFPSVAATCQFRVWPPAASTENGAEYGVDEPLSRRYDKIPLPLFAALIVMLLEQPLTVWFAFAAGDEAEEIFAQFTAFGVTS